MATNNSTLSALKTSRKNIIKSFSKANDKAMAITENLIEETVETGEKIQKITIKAMKKSQPIMEKQMDIVLESIEEMKDQFSSANKRTLKLLGLTQQSKNLKKNISSLIKGTKKQLAKAEKYTEKYTEKFGKEAIAEVAEIKSKVAKTAKTARRKVKATKATTVTNNLKVIPGIGPKMESLLQDAGIKTYADLISASPKALQEIIAAAGPRFKKSKPSNWIKSAKTILKNK